MTTDTFAPLPPATPAAAEPIEEHEADAVQPMQPARDPLPEFIQHRRFGIASKVWPSRDASGALLFAVARFDQRNGDKQVLPFTCGPDSWVFKAPQPPRSLYNLDLHAARPEAPVLIVEGEKAADAAAVLFPDWVPMTWQGGSNAVNKSDCSPLRGRRVVIIPDNDVPGRKAAAAVARAAKQAGAASVGIVEVPTEWPAGWDVADALPEGVTTDTLLAMLAAAEVVAPPADVPTISDRDAELQRLALLDDVGFALERRDAAKGLGISLSDLMAAVKATRRDIRRAEREAARERITGGQPAWTESGLPPDPYGREDLFVQRSDLPLVAQEGLRRLTTRERIMYRGGLVRLVYDAQRNGLVVETLSVHALVSELHAIARPYIQRAQSDGTGACSSRATCYPTMASSLS
jgi:hypothetical protein